MASEQTPKVTMYRSILATKSSDAHHVPIDSVLDRIKNGGSTRSKVEAIRASTDADERSRLKKELPCIIFSGEFGDRNDTGIKKHSGYIVLDFDHVDPKSFKDKIRPYPWWRAMFVSPSGDGLKVVVRIPSDTARHRGFFRGLAAELSWIGAVDESGVNISRVCYESYDPDIEIREEDKTAVFDVYMEGPLAENTSPSEIRVATYTDYRLLERCAKVVRMAKDGEKHAALIRAARTAGGFIAAGHVEEDEAIRVLEREILRHDIKDFAAAKHDIRDGIDYGKRDPLAVADTDEEVIPEDLDEDEVLATDKIKDYIEEVRTVGLKMGLSTGFPSLDAHYVMKKGNFVIVNGFDNVGKTAFLLYLAAVSAKLHGWRWILFCAENYEGETAENIMEYFIGKQLTAMTDAEKDRALAWVMDHFAIIDTSLASYTAEQVLKVAKKLHSARPFDSLLIDPYNSLDMPKDEQNRHEYDYRITSSIRRFCKNTGMSVYLNVHAVTSAARTLHKDGVYAGHQQPPSKQDTEGGNKFSNRADDFLTIHRYVSHPEDWMKTHVYVRKIKVMKTGGRVTPFDAPVVIRMYRGSYGFFEDGGSRNPFSSVRLDTATRSRVVYGEDELEIRNYGNPSHDSDAPF